jgi:hypothetical protein
MFGKLMHAAEAVAENKSVQEAVSEHLGGASGGSHRDTDSNTLDTGIDLPTSTCDGNKKSLFVGINYTGSQHELHGCINDVANIKAFVCPSNAWWGDFNTN